jgi:hypothetical protein
MSFFCLLPIYLKSKNPHNYKVNKMDNNNNNLFVVNITIDTLKSTLQPLEVVISSGETILHEPHLLFVNFPRFTIECIINSVFIAMYNKAECIQVNISKEHKKLKKIIKAYFTEFFKDRKEENKPSLSYIIFK